MSGFAFALPTVPPPIPPAIRVESACIQVSGHPSLPAQRFWAGSRCLGIFSDTASFDVRGHFEEKVRCPKCGTAHYPSSGLGWPTYCEDCAKPLVSRCAVTNGRHPAEGEFFCALCGRILPQAQMCAREKTGWWRPRCLDCRKEQVERAKVRYKARWNGHDVGA